MFPSEWIWVKLHCWTFSMSTLSCLSPSEEIVSSSETLCSLSLIDSFLIHRVLLLLCLHSVLTVPFLFTPSSSHPIFNFSRLCCSPFVSALRFLLSLHVCASLCSHQVHFCPIMPYIIIPTLLPVIPFVSLFALSESERRHSSISPTALWSGGFSAVLLCCAPTVSSLAHLHQLCCTFFCHC